MEKQQFHLFLSSVDSMEYYPQNYPGQFLIHLPETLKLEGEWWVGLSDISYPEPLNSSCINVMTNICEDSAWRGTKQAILRRIPTQGNINHHIFTIPYYQRVRGKEIDWLSIYIRDENNQPVSFLKGTLTCTLHFCCGYNLFGIQ